MENKPDKSNKQPPSTNVDYGQQFWEFLNGANFHEVVNAIFKNQVDERKTFVKTYLIDILLVFILLISVIRVS